jgi:DNA primase
MKILELFNDYNIRTAPTEHRHYQAGWVNVECPFCTGNPGYHLGYNTDDDYFHCWRCGRHKIIDSLSKLLHISFSETRQVIRQYRGVTKKTDQRKANKRVNLSPFKFPTNTSSLKKGHYKYLQNRKFSPKEIEHTWKVQGTGIISKLDGINYSKRILIPILWDGEVVSFQTRDITNKHPKKYLACPMKREVMHHKHILYGMQDAWGDEGICVEGVFDVWRLGVNSFATFGTSYTSQQVRQIAKHFKRVYICFDNEPQAQKKARQLQSELSFRGLSCKIIKISTDPADLTPQEANMLVENLLKN